MDNVALDEPLFWIKVPRLRFESDIWPCATDLSIQVATDARDIDWGDHTISDITYIIHEYFWNS